jgi:hypothetical protein
MLFVRFSSVSDLYRWCLIVLGIPSLSFQADYFDHFVWEHYSEYNSG